VRSRGRRPWFLNLLNCPKKSRRAVELLYWRFVVRSTPCALAASSGAGERRAGGCFNGSERIGKSRLVSTLGERAAQQPHTRLRYYCSVQHMDTALYPVISQVETAAKIEHDDTLGAKLEKLDVLLAQYSSSRPDAALIADMLSLPNDGRFPAKFPRVRTMVSADGGLSCGRDRSRGIRCLECGRSDVCRGRGRGR
jgi:hypothetical protein